MKGLVFYLISVAFLIATITSLSVIYEQEKRKVHLMSASMDHHPQSAAQVKHFSFRLQWPQFRLEEVIEADGHTQYEKAQAGDQFGTLGLNSTGTVLAVGAPFENGAQDNSQSVGALYVSTCDGNGCKQVFFLRGKMETESFGSHVLVKQNRIFVMSNTAIYIFKLDSHSECQNQWDLEQKIDFHLNSRSAPEMFMVADEEGTKLFVCFPTEKNSTHIQMFKRGELNNNKNHDDDTTWNQYGKTRTITFEVTATTCSPNGDTLVLVNNKPSVIVFSWNQDNGGLREEYQSDLEHDGLAVSFSSENFVIGCPHANDLRGLFVLFRRVKKMSYDDVQPKNQPQNYHYKQTTNYSLEDARPGCKFGYVKLSPDGLIMGIGAPGDSTQNHLTATENYGSVFIFRRHDLQEEFTLCQKIVNPGKEPGVWGMFGTTIEFSQNGQVMFVSAKGGTSNANEVISGQVFKFTTSGSS